MVPGVTSLIIFFIVVLTTLLARKDDLKKYWPIWWGKTIIIGVVIIWVGASVCNIAASSTNGKEITDSVNANTDSVGSDIKKSLTHLDSTLQDITADPHKARIYLCNGQVNNGSLAPKVQPLPYKDSIQLKLNICNYGKGTAYDFVNKCVLVAVFPDSIIIIGPRPRNAFNEYTRLPGYMSIPFFEPLRYDSEKLPNSDPTVKYIYCIKLNYRDDLGKDSVIQMIQLAYNAADNATRSPNRELFVKIKERLTKANYW